MEKKTIGSFISVLRKANGMTQKQLAEMLNVSDKTVSRWERDESAPDLTLIPVIAEISGVTSDELLRGEKASKEVSYESTNESKKEKQLRRIAEAGKTKLSVRSIISIGIAVTGLIAAMIANFGFNRAQIGFFICCIFIVASVICETVFTILAFSSVNTQDYEEETVNGCRKKFFDLTCLTFYIIALLFVASLPLVLNPIGTGYFGILWETWGFYGLIYIAAAALICCVFNVFIRRYAINRGIFFVDEAEAIKIKRISKLTLRSLVCYLIVLAITVVSHIALNGIIPTTFFAEGTVFENYNDFKAFMETDMPDDSYAEMTVIATQTMPVPNYEDASDSEEIIYYDDYGNEISEEEALTEYVYDKDGHILCRYINRNGTVRSIEYNHSAEDLLPVTVYTNEQWHNARRQIDIFNTMFIAAYCIELAATVLIYITKRRKIK